MEKQIVYLGFEAEILQIDRAIKRLEELSSRRGIDCSLEIRNLQQNRLSVMQQVYSNLNAWQLVQVARHEKRPIITDYINIMIKNFCGLHGDKCFGDDHAIVTGFGEIGRQKVMIVGHNKGRGTKEKVACRFGCPNPEGYRKALSKMRLAEKFDIPIVTLIDTPGAYPGIEAEERGQAQAIAVNLMEMSRLKVPIICVVIGEGGSGGALGIGVGDKLAMLQFAYFSVISPEGCAAIIWRDGKEAEKAAEALKLTSKDNLSLGIIDTIIPEPLGGAHNNLRETIFNVEEYIIKTLGELKCVEINTLLKRRYEKYRLIGSNFVETAEN